MDPKKFYGGSKAKKRDVTVRDICGYESEDSVLASDSDDEFQTLVNRPNHEKIILPESDESCDGESHSDGGDGAGDNDDGGGGDDDDNNDFNNVDIDCDTEANVWRRVHTRVACPIQSWKGTLPPAPEIPFTPINYFKQLLNNDILDNAVFQTNLYSVQRDSCKPISISRDELEQFFGCCMYMSIYGLPSSRMYWKTTTRVPFVADTMCRNHWEQIKLGLHFNDRPNSKLDPNDKIYKIRPLLQPLVDNMRAVGLPMNEKLSIDEQMIPFKGRHSLKNYVKNKPKKWGYKAFVLCSSEGIAHKFELYTGKAVHDPSLPDIGVSSNVVLRLASVIP